MRKRVLAVVVVIAGSAAGPAAANPDPVPPDLVRYRGPIEHIFVHPLLPAPRYTLRRGTQPQEFNKWSITVREFRRMLPQLYANDWVLVDLESSIRKVRTPRGPVYKMAKLKLPPGKKPLVLSIDDLNYPQYMIDNHLNSKLVLDGDGNVAAERVTPNGTTLVTRRSEVVPLVDRFVEKHPDFSINGAKGIIALTGVEGILGYRTSGDGRRARREQRRAAPIVERLKATGWTFGSHSYAHPDMSTSSLARLQQDTDRWERYVQPLVGGNPRVYVYPFGAPATGAGLAYLRRAGFRIFCSISPAARLVLEDGYVIQDRVRVDGLALLKQPATLKRFFDPASVVDPVRPALTG
jgi:hypothetical protein